MYQIAVLLGAIVLVAVFVFMGILIAVDEYQSVHPTNYHGLDGKGNHK